MCSSRFWLKARLKFFQDVFFFPSFYCLKTLKLLYVANAAVNIPVLQEEISQFVHILCKDTLVMRKYINGFLAILSGRNVFKTNYCDICFSRGGVIFCFTGKWN